MATATATKTTHNGSTSRKITPQTITVEAVISEGLLEGKRVDLTFAPDGSLLGMSDPKLTPEELEAWDELMAVSKRAENSALRLQKTVDKLNTTLESVEEFLNEDRE